jgi:hypothetical protein
MNRTRKTRILRAIAAITALFLELGGEPDEASTGLAADDEVEGGTVELTLACG